MAYCWKLQCHVAQYQYKHHTYSRWSQVSKCLLSPQGERTYSKIKYQKDCVVCQSVQLPPYGRFIRKKSLCCFDPFKAIRCVIDGIFFLLPETWANNWQHGVTLPSLKLSTCFLVTWDGSQGGEFPTWYVYKPQFSAPAQLVQCCVYSYTRTHHRWH